MIVTTVAPVARYPCYLMFLATWPLDEKAVLHSTTRVWFMSTVSCFPLGCSVRPCNRRCGTLLSMYDLYSYSSTSGCLSLISAAYACVLMLGPPRRLLVLDVD
jgi:hypothetical protein